MKTATVVSGLCAALAATLTPAVAAWAAAPPAAVSAMLVAAAASGDPAALKIVADLARKTNPDSQTEIDAQVSRLTPTTPPGITAETPRRRLLPPSVKGEVQAGVTSESGNTRNTNLALGFTLSDESARWKNTLKASADYERSNGAVTQEKYLVSYAGEYKFNLRLYLLGETSWNRDHFAGYSSRVGGSVDVGYKLIATPSVSLSLETGPTARRTDYLGVTSAPGQDQIEFGGRVASAVSWTIAPNLAVSEEFAAFYGPGDKTFTSTTALTTKIIAGLSARAAFALQHDSRPPAGIHGTDTATRLTLVYGF